MIVFGMVVKDLPGFSILVPCLQLYASWILMSAEDVAVCISTRSGANIRIEWSILNTDLSANSIQSTRIGLPHPAGLTRTSLLLSFKNFLAHDRWDKITRFIVVQGWLASSFLLHVIFEKVLNFFVKNLENVSITFCLRRALFNAQHKLSLRLKTSKIPLLFPAWHSASKGGCPYWKDKYKILRYKSEVSHQFVYKSVPRSFLTFSLRDGSGYQNG